MKKLLVLVLAVGMLTVPVAADEFSDGTAFNDGSEWGLSTYEGIYPLTGIVTEIEYNAEPGLDLLTITCANGNMFSWYEESTDCWELYDLASCLMNSNGTKFVYDDEVILAHYAGGLNQLAEYTAE